METNIGIGITNQIGIILLDVFYFSTESGQHLVLEDNSNLIL